MTDPDESPVHIRAAHKRSIHHRDEVMRSDLCGCFHCLATFSPSKIAEWTDHSEPPDRHTAMCPRCGIDAVLGSASGYPLERAFLEEMQHYWFGCDEDEDENGNASAG
jgi:hypothetical protein